MGEKPTERFVEERDQTQHKLETMQRYFGAWATIIARATRTGYCNRQLWIIDTHAGQGIHLSATDPDGVVAGTPLLALLAARKVQAAYPATTVHVRATDTEKAKAEHLWELVKRVAVAEINGAPWIVTGSWDHRTVSAYEAATGRLIWRQGGLGRVQEVVFARDDGVVAAVFDRGPIRLLSTYSGEDLATLKGGRAFWQAKDPSIAVVVRSSRIALVDTSEWRAVWSVPVQGFAVLAVAFSSAGIAVADAVPYDGPGSATVSGFSLDGTAAWVYQCSPGRNVPWLGWIEDAREWVGVEHATNRTGSDELLRWDERGRVVSRMPVTARQPFAFASDGTQLVASDGKVLDTRTGALTGAIG